MGNYIGKTRQEYAKEWYALNRDKRLQQEEERRTDPRYIVDVMLTRARRRAKNKGLEFNITLEDITTSTHCSIFPWIELTTITGKGFVESNMSLDRIDSTKGYVPGNVHIISYKANRNKNNSTLKELVALGEWANAILNSQ